METYLRMMVLKAQVLDNAKGLILDHSEHTGNPSDTHLIRPAITRVRDRFTQSPLLVTADRGYWEPAIGTDLHDLDRAPCRRSPVRFAWRRAARIPSPALSQ